MNSIRPAIWKSAIEVQELFVDLGFQFCFIGGIAVQRWGEPRVTKDLDLTLITGFGDETKFIRLLMEYFSPRIDDAATFAVYSRVLLAEDHRGTPIDIALGGLPFEERAVARASYWGIPRSGEIYTCSAEDLIVLKGFANRPRDWEDVESILIRQSGRVNQSQILEELTPLAELKEEPEILSRLNDLFESTSRI